MIRGTVPLILMETADSVAIRRYEGGTAMMIRNLVVFGLSAIPMLAGGPVAVVPEPSSILMLGGGLVALGFLANRKRRK